MIVDLHSKCADFSCQHERCRDCSVDTHYYEKSHKSVPIVKAESVVVASKARTGCENCK